MNPESSKYVVEQRHEYSMYVLQSRALPCITDGLKPAARRVLWTARNGKKYKSATLAGAVMPIHPHAQPDSTINTLAAPYGNNIPFLDGVGAFGTLLYPNSYGASRYTSVKVSEFCKDVIFSDIEIIPMQENYDGTLEEPKHFLPLIPTVLLNSTSGIAVGFACDILPRSLDDIINSQIRYLTNKPKTKVFPTFIPTNAQAVERIDQNKWVFYGSCTQKNSTTVVIDSLPYGILHEKFINNLIKLIDSNEILDYEDNSSDVIDISIKFKRGVVDTIKKEDMLVLLGLKNTVSENMNMINFDHTSVWQAEYHSVIEQFTEWRLGWYELRYQRLLQLVNKEIQKYTDILTAIDKNIGSVARKINSRQELKEKLTEINIVYVDYIADLPVYRFTNDEKNKTKAKLKDAKKLMKNYEKLLNSKEARKKIYIEELNNVLNKYIVKNKKPLLEF